MEGNRMALLMVVAAAIGFALFAAGCSQSQQYQNPPAQQQAQKAQPTVVCPQQKTCTGIPASQAQLKAGMRKLWEEHVTWTRLFIISYVDGLNDTQQAEKRLLHNYNDMEDALKAYYPNAQAEKFGDLIQDHLVIAANLVAAAKTGNATGAAQYEAAWYKNADDIAAQLHSMNPNLPEAAVKDMMYMHLKLTKQEAVDRLTHNYDDDVTNYDAIHDEALQMSDAISEGIIKQFPAKFAS